MACFNACRGFTLAELLIALAILGVIATFTIPKVLLAQQSAQNKAIVKEAIASVVGAYQAYSLSNAPTQNTGGTNLTPYLNYVTMTTNVPGVIDYPIAGIGDCTSASPCLKLHNGAWLKLYSTTFGGTANTNMIWFLVDPDASKTGSPSGGGVEFALYVNGRVATWATLQTGSTSSWGTDVADPSGDPKWFSWN